MMKGRKGAGAQEDGFPLSPLSPYGLKDTFLSKLIYKVRIGLPVTQETL